jgi:hypothetical protein
MTKEELKNLYLYFLSLAILSMLVDMSSFIIVNLVCLYLDMYNLASYL